MISRVAQYSFNHFNALSRRAVNFRFSENEGSDDDFKKQTTVEITNENAQQIIDKWVKSNRVVLFMKGTPQAPMCGYSNYVVELLKKYGTFM